LKRYAALLAMVVAAAPAGAEVRYSTFRSAALGREVGYAVQLPPSYGTGQRRYPVLYVLHGLFEGPDFWEQRGLPRILEDASRNGGKARRSSAPATPARQEAINFLDAIT